MTPTLGGPTVSAMTDILGGAPEADPDLDYGPAAPGFFSEPTTLAFIAFPLAVLTVLGAQVFRGINYTVALAPSTIDTFSSDSSAPKPSTTWLVAGAFLTAAFSLLPLMAGLRGLRRLVDEDPPWLGGLLRAAVALAGLTLSLRLVSAVILTLNVDTGSALLNYLGVS
jgi:hypothetical protein